MKAIPAAEDVELFRAAVSSRLGLYFEDAKVGFLGEVLRRRLDATGRDCGSYLRDLEAEQVGGELGMLADELTVPETYFLRNIEQFHALAQSVVPDRVRARGADGGLRILSAGCASGEEAFSVAMLLQETLDPGWPWSVLAVDLSPSALKRAQTGRYSPWSLRGVPPDVQERWFTRSGQDVVLAEAIRMAVTFEQRNLAEDDGELWREDGYDVVFCRNVLMYFTPERRRELVGRIAGSLRPGGYLFLGHAENLRGLSQELDLRHTHETFYYQRKAGRAHPLAEVPASLDPPPQQSPSLASLVEQTDTWVDAIRMATERVQRLVDEPPPPATRPRDGECPPPTPRWDFSWALALLRSEQFAEALELIEALPPAAAVDPDVLLLNAVLLTHAGLLERAQSVCVRLLDIDGLNAGAHYVLALCREGTGDLEGAVEHDQMAVHLDARFAMPRLHLGLIARRGGDLEGMRRELGDAVTLLEGEDASRLLLFGGGFSREALTALCRAALLVNGQVLS
jgi:chemotaxis protein methyltransferase CheR